MPSAPKDDITYAKWYVYSVIYHLIALNDSLTHSLTCQLVHPSLSTLFGVLQLAYRRVVNYFGVRVVPSDDNDVILSSLAPYVINVYAMYHTIQNNSIHLTPAGRENQLLSIKESRANIAALFHQATVIMMTTMMILSL